MTKLYMVGVDPQNDFMDDGKLPAMGAKDDMARMTKFINRNQSIISEIFITLDEHHVVDIAHPLMWLDGNNEQVKPFTVITTEDILSGKYKTKEITFARKALKYVQALEEKGKHNLVIWNTHCIKGSTGALVCEPLCTSIYNWQKETGGLITSIHKGYHMFTEHYNPLRAEIPDPDVPETQLNTKFLEQLRKADLIGIFGEASTHCVAEFGYDLIETLGKEHISKLVFIKDCMSPIAGFEEFERMFFHAMIEAGAYCCTLAEFKRLL